MGQTERGAELNSENLKGKYKLGNLNKDERITVEMKLTDMGHECVG
jgi:hypothetical protein